MTKVVNDYGVEINFEVARNMMDENIVSEMEAQRWFESDQEFFDEYAKRHAETYGAEDWEPAQESPVM